jgi:predicted TIM-barrel fold metal-dependent hydrolase
MPENETEEQDQPNVKIIDSHCHIASGEHIPKSFIEGSVANMVAAFSANGLPVTAKKLMAMFDQKMQDPLCDALVTEMSSAGVSKSVLLIADFSFALKDCVLTIEESFQKHRKVLERHPDKFEVFGGVDPRWGKDGLALFERSIVEFGFRGLKLYPPCGYSPSDPALFPFYELCAHHRLPVLLHVGPTSPALSFTTASPFLVDEAAHRFPTVNFILAHGATSFTDECAALCRFRPNVFLDISAFQTLAQQGMESALRKTFSQGINHKVLFGTDWPVFRLQGDQRAFVEAVTAEDGPMDELNASEKSLVLHRNIERLLAQRDQPQA